MPIDRDATLKQAEKLLRQGKLEGAIAEYVRLVQDQPRDLNSINALGDLYVRAGQLDRAVAQFTHIADVMFAEGFVPKASALYKKALRIKPDHQHTLRQLSEIAARQGLLVDARNYLRQLGRLLRDRGDARGADEILVRLAMLEEADGESRLTGARAAHALGDTARAVELFRAAGEALSREGRQRDALDALAEAAALAPDDADLRRQAAREAISAGELARARTLLTPESAGVDPELLLALGRMELAAGRDAEARLAFTRMVAVAPDRIGMLHELTEELQRTGAIAGAFVCTEVLVDDALLAGDWDRALDALRALLATAPYIPALVKLVELAVDAGREDVMEGTQAQLADAYLDAGRADEARVIAEDLVARQPDSEPHVDRLRRVLAVLGVDDAEAIVNRYREAREDDGEVLDLDEAFDPGVDVRPSDESAPIPPSTATPANTTAVEGSRGGEPWLAALSERDPHGPPMTSRPGLPDEESDAIVLDMLEIDLSDTLADLGAASPPPAGDSNAAEPRDLESVFEDLRTRASRQQPGGDGTKEYESGLRELGQGRVVEAMASLRAAARMPLYRFRAAARLGRLYIGRGEIAEGIEWLERAAEAPPPSPDEGWAVLYDLADALDQSGESARALAVLLELEADADGYRDVRRRVEALSRTQTGRG